MIPKTDIRYNFDYARRLYAGDKDFNEVWENIIRQGRDFEVVYEEYIDRMLSLIPIVTGYPWEEDHVDPFVPIYVVDTLQSFPRPLTISVDESIDMMVAQLICQLVHQNVRYGFKEESQRASAVLLAAAAVAHRLGIDLEDSFQEAESMNVVRYGSGYTPQSWNLGEHTLKYYLEQPR